MGRLQTKNLSLEELCKKKNEFDLFQTKRGKLVYLELIMYRRRQLKKKNFFRGFRSIHHRISLSSELRDGKSPLGFI